MLSFGFGDCEAGHRLDVAQIAKEVSETVPLPVCSRRAHVDCLQRCQHVWRISPSGIERFGCCRSVLRVHLLPPNRERRAQAIMRATARQTIHNAAGEVLGPIIGGHPE